MKNLTEFPGFLLRRANAVRVEKLKELRAQADTQAEPANTEADADQSDASSEAAPDAPADGVSEPEPKADAAEVAAETTSEQSQDNADAPETAVAADSPKEDGAPKRPEVDEGALAAAVGEVLKISDDRLTYLMGALQAVGRKGIDKVRQVRVFKGEEAPAGAFSIDDLHFVVDRIVSTNSKKTDGKGRGRDGKGRGDKRGDNKGRSSGGGGGGGGGQKGGHGFDSLARDEKPGDVPSGGLGWSLERAPGSDRKEGRGRGKPGRKGPRRGKPGDKPGDNRNRGRGNRSGGKKPPMPEVIVKAPTVTPSEKK